ncbi:MAG: radical SAM protein [Elusimicrobia bacterium]|nr:radical SAM protein [Elusimicrobiota bacterium]
MDMQGPLTVAWQITNHCNLRCLHCLKESGPQKKNSGGSDGSLIDRILGQIADAKVPYVLVCGGEPLTHPRFFDICEFLCRKNISCKVETNGHLLNRQTAKRLAMLGARSVQVSLDGVSADTYSRLRPGGSWDKAIEACRLLQAEGVPLEITFVPVKFNIREAGAVIDLAVSLGAWQFNTGRLIPLGRARKAFKALSPSPRQYQVFLDTLKSKKQELSGKIQIVWEPFDIFSALRLQLEHMPATLLVEPDGKARISGMLPYICGDLAKESLGEVWAGFKKLWHDPEVVKFAYELIKMDNESDLKIPLG